MERGSLDGTINGRNYHRGKTVAMNVPKNSVANNYTYNLLVDR
jgi:hypothetical protein